MTTTTTDDRASTTVIIKSLKGKAPPSSMMMMMMPLKNNSSHSSSTVASAAASSPPPPPPPAVVVQVRPPPPDHDHHHHHHPDDGEDDDDDDDEDRWITPPLSRQNPLHQTLRELEQTLRCPICREWLKAPVALQPCQHIFCSLCLRQALAQYKRRGSLKRGVVYCPQCKYELKESETGPEFSKCLVPNHALEKIVHLFQQGRASLLAALRPVPPTTAPPAPLLSHHHHQQQLQLQQQEEEEEDDEKLGDEAHNEAPDMPEEETKNPPETRVATQLPVMPRWDYTHLKKKKLQELCQQVGLSKEGSEADLKDRHRALCDLVQAERDSAQPRPLDALVQQVHQQEAARRREARRHETQAEYTAACLKNMKQQQQQQLGAAAATETTAGPTRWSSGDRRFDALLETKFQAMIRQLRADKARQNAAPAPTDNSGFHRSTTSSKTKEGGVSHDEPVVQNPPRSRMDHSIPNLPQKPVPADADHFLGAIKSECKKDEADESLRAPILGESQPSTRSSDTTAPSMISHGWPCQPMEMDSGTIMNPQYTSSSDLGRSARRPSTRTSSNNKKRKDRPEEDIVALVDASKVPNGSSFRRKSGPGGLIGPWSCPQCTFFNELRTYPTARCEACEGPRS